MAGNYPDAPSRRLAWDDDGTEGLAVSYAAPDGPIVAEGVAPVNPLSLMTVAQRQNLNGEDNTAGFIHYTDVQYIGGIYCYLIFPDDRDIDGYYFSLYGSVFNSHRWFYTSSDTTTGFDGTWSTIGVINWATEPVNPNYREDIKTAASTGVRGAYFAVDRTDGSIAVGDLRISAMHLYGTPSAAGNSHRFLFLDTADSDAEYTALIDDGNVGRGADSAFNFKIKNNSATQQANTVQVTTTNLVRDSEQWYTLSTDDVIYQATAQPGDIAALGTATIYVKKNIPDDELLGLHSARFKVSKASWT